MSAPAREAPVVRSGPWCAATCRCGWASPRRSSERRVERDLAEHACLLDPARGSGAGAAGAAGA
ncbi:hypothetical protein [Vallicoccus soli]|uniref:Uncharacterized protein n=1 Tax=Vallicoccus soli TaxID=2339232 RepID=A0A3A3Z3S7_9ACTN|nr:hypothetical protein [Vallicoccus soli]RJK97558.1 hypothetical protein D5H78_00515 [Vallicoccus soli]